MIHGKNKSTQWFQVGTFKIYVIANRSSLLLLLVAMNINLKHSLTSVSWSQLKSKNIETLYFLKALKEPVQIDYALLWNKHEYQHSADIFVKYIFNPICGTGLFLYSLKCIRKPGISWCFQGTS